MNTADSTDGQARVAFQGAPGAFSHAACLALRPWDEPVGFETFEAAISAVTGGDCHMALIPVENSTIGTVQPAADLVAASGLRVVGEVWRPIRLALMAPLGARLSTLKTVESHPAALGQCRATLAELRLEAREVFDTAGAAHGVAASGDVSRAAVAPPSAAEIYGLSILRHDIQDMVGNRTRFVLLGRSQA